MSTRPRVRAVLGCVAVIGCIGLPSTFTSSIRLRLLSLASPAERGLTSAGTGLASVFDALVPESARRVRALEAENKDLREQLARKQAELDARGRDLAMQTGVPPHVRQMDNLSVSVIGEGSGVQQGLFFIDRGSDDGIRTGMAVIAGDSVIGRVRAVSPGASAVLAITARGSAVEAAVSSAEPEPGILVGLGDGTMRMKYVSRTQPAIGTLIVSRGRDGMTPGGMVFGVVVHAERSAGQLNYDIIVRPVRDASRLSTVIVVRPKVTSDNYPAGGGEIDRGR